MSGRAVATALAAALGWVAVAAGGIAFVAQWTGTPTGWIAIVQSLTPWLLPPVVMAAIVAATAGRNVLGFAGATVGLALLAVTAPLVFAARGPHAAAGTATVRLATSNLLYTNDHVVDAADRLGDLDADVLAMNEVTHALAAQLHDTDLAARYPHRIEVPAPFTGGVMLWSRFPLVDHGPPSGFRLSQAIDATVAAPGGPVRVLVVHPPAPVYDRERWERELDLTAAAVRRASEPVVVLGDLNSSWFHPPLRDLLADVGLRDALVALGRPFAMTWPTDRPGPPFVTLDHVLVDDGMAIVDGGTADVAGSDHRAVWTDIARA